MTYELGVLGAGKMAEAIVRGVTAAKLFEPRQILAADVAAPRRELFEKQLGVRAVEENRDVARQSKVLLLSVKPQQMAEALAGIGQVMDEKALVVSIAAGVTTAFIEKHLGGGKKWRVVRAMPNTPMLLGEGMVGLAAGANVSRDEVEVAKRIFESAAAVVEVPEPQLDAVTAVSGSGPAYFFYLVEQMIRAGIELGLPPEQARLLAAKTASGAAKMLLQSGESPEQLRKHVTSPGGTTQAAIEHMEAKGVGPAVVEAIHKADRRCKELSQ